MILQLHVSYLKIFAFHIKLYFSPFVKDAPVLYNQMKLAAEG